MSAIAAAIKLGTALVAKSDSPGIVTLKVPANATYADITLDGTASTPGTGGGPSISVWDWQVNGNPCYDPSDEEVGNTSTATIRIPLQQAGATSSTVTLGVGDGTNITGDHPAALSVVIEWLA